MKTVKITDVAVKGPRTTVGVKIKIAGGVVYGRGRSKCREDDVFSEQVGFDIALGRAIKDIGDQLEHAAGLRVVTNDELGRVLALAAQQPEILD